MSGSPRGFVRFITATLVLLALKSMTAYVGTAPTPVSAHADKKLEGAELFGSRGCTHCHGVEGTGTDKGPSLRDVRKRLKSEQIADQIKHGGKEMPAFEGSLDGDQIAEIVAFLDAKRWQAVPVPSAPTP